MKKIRILLSFALAIAVCATVAYAQSSVGVGLQIRDFSPPAINFLGLMNNSGFNFGNFSFFYNVSDESSLSHCFLVMDHRSNITNESATTNATLSFNLNNLPVGRYNFSINCTDSFGFIGSAQTFSITVNSMKKFNGTTTNLSSVDTRNITHFVAEVPSYGKINFSDYTDLSQGLDLDSFVNISFNKIELDSNVLSALNKSATLQLVGLAFSNPRILFNGVVCPESICRKISYDASNGVLTFNVSHWTSYEAEETPGGGGGDTGGGTSGGGGGGSSGGGGGGGAPANPISTDFTIDKLTLKIVLKQGQTKTERISVKNIGTSIFEVKADLSTIEKFRVPPYENEVAHILNPDEEKTIELVFKALENEKPDIYPSEIVLNSPSVEKRITTIVEVDSAEPLFDVDVEVLSQSKKVFPGDEILLEVNLFNVRGFGRVDVAVEYMIKDLKGNLIASEHETLAVETQSKFTRALTIPSDLLPGTYVAFARVNYADSVGTSSDLFEVTAKSIRLLPIQIQGYKSILLFGAAILVVGLLLFSAYRFGYFRKRAPKTKVEEVKQLKGEEKAQKLRKELEAVESAYKSGFISGESYQKDKKRIEEKLKILK